MNLPGFERVPNGATMAQLDGSELLLGVRFPQAYRELMVAFSGAYGEAKLSPQGSASTREIGHLLSVDPWDTDSLWVCLATWSECKLPRTIIPFGSDSVGGNPICFDYRKGPVPTIVVWRHEFEGESGLQLVSATFEDFLDSLHEPEA